ncbi:hypothetical protein FB451DRAFT_1031487 [Mycena latifolia]|nr:hypothetical protein FB451DRAFT_1031487 [Mycena latifolia]
MRTVLGPTSLIDITDLLERFAPRIHARQTLTLEQLAENNTVYPAFDGSVFTTVEFSLGNVPPAICRETYNAYGSWRAITALGDYDANLGGWLLWFRENEGDRLAIRFPPGATFVFPASIVRYCFSPVRRGEKRYLFQQFYNAAVGRWVDQGFRSDSDYAAMSGREEWETHQDRRWERVTVTIDAMSKVDEIFV